MSSTQVHWYCTLLHSSHLDLCGIIVEMGFKEQNIWIPDDQQSFPQIKGWLNEFTATTICIYYMYSSVVYSMWLDWEQGPIVTLSRC